MSKKVRKNSLKKLKRTQKCKKVSKRQNFIVLVLLFAHAERVGFSRRRNFFLFLFVDLNPVDNKLDEVGRTS